MFRAADLVRLRADLATRDLAAPVMPAAGSPLPGLDQEAGPRDYRSMSGQTARQRMPLTSSAAFEKYGTRVPTPLRQATPWRWREGSSDAVDRGAPAGPTE